MKNTLTLCWVLAVFFSCSPKSEKQSIANSKVSDSEYAGCCTPEILDTAWYSSGKKAPLFSGLDGIKFSITTTNPEAQKYFNQGMMLALGFNHAEAGRAFFEAARLDSTCAMCWWGFAYVLGPNYNAGMEPDNFVRAYNAIQKAKSVSSNISAKEKDLIDAMSYRYTNDTTIERAYLDSVYAAQMRQVYQKYSGDANIGTLFAESLMDLHPWNLWKKDGTIQPWTPEIIDVLEKCLKLDPMHAGVNHLYIHATEMSNNAEVAFPSADLLRTLVPGSGHLVHMPSHTYIRTGRYHDGVIANQKAVMVDSLYFVACHAQGVYPLAYYPHNHHFISACATLSGESKTAMLGANATSQHAHKKLFREPGWATLQHYYSIPWFVMVKLGLWNEIQNSSAPESDLIYPSVIWNYSQGMAMLSQKNITEAKNHLTEMNTLMKDSSLKELTIWGINNVFDICVIASKVLDGEIKAAEKNYPAAILSLREAVNFEDALNYDEPPDWFFSVRHHLGAVLIEAQQYDEAIKVYEDDLKTYRNNGWALKGLMNVFEKTGNKKRYIETKSKFDEAWKYADVKIASSRIL